MIQVPSPVGLDTSPEAIPLNIIFEDEYLIALDKPVGMVVHPAPGHFSGTRSLQLGQQRAQSAIFFFSILFSSVDQS